MSENAEYDDNCMPGWNCALGRMYISRSTSSLRKQSRPSSNSWSYASVFSTQPSMNPCEGTALCGSQLSWDIDCQSIIGPAINGMLAADFNIYCVNNLNRDSTRMN